MENTEINILNLEPTQLLEFPIDHIVDNSETDFDLFLPVEGHWVLYGGAGYRWFKAELEALLKNGFSHFLIRTEDTNKAKMYQVMARLPEENQNTAPIERIRSIEDIGASFVSCLYEGEITQACVRKGESLAGSVVDCISEDRTCIQALGALADHDYYTYYHSVRVACYGVAVALQLGIRDENHLREIAIGGLFHDVGKKIIPLEILNKPGSLTTNEWALMRAHPEKGHELLESTLLNFIPREIVLHHHEKLDGSGYPNQLDRNSLIFEVQVATLADVFDALTSSRAYQNKRTKFEALHFIKNKMLGSKLSKEAFSALVRCLA